MPGKLIDVKKELRSWTREQLLEFALEVVDAYPDVHGQLVRVIDAKANPKGAGTRLKAQIDSVLAVRSVEPRQVDAWILRLEGVLNAILALGERSPAEALEAVRHFIDEIPTTFNLVEDETEQAMFCRELMEAAVKLTRAAGASELELGEKLLDAYVRDMNQFAKMDDALDVMLEAGFGADTRRAIVALAIEKAKGKQEHNQKNLRGFAAKLTKGKAGAKC